MDGLARYRRALGARAPKGTVSINYGAVFATDHVVNRASLMDGRYLERYDHISSVSTTLDKIEICLEAYIRQGCMLDDLATELPAQLILGIADDLPARCNHWMGDPRFIHRMENANVLSSVEIESDGTRIAKSLAASTSLQSATSTIINSR